MLCEVHIINYFGFIQRMAASSKRTGNVVEETPWRTSEKWSKHFTNCYSIIWWIENSKKIPILRFPSGNVCTFSLIVYLVALGFCGSDHKFTTTLQNVFDFVRAKEPSNEKYILVSQFPRKVYTDPTMTIQAAGLFPQALLYVEEEISSSNTQPKPESWKMLFFNLQILNYLSSNGRLLLECWVQINHINFEHFQSCCIESKVTKRFDLFIKCESFKRLLFQSEEWKKFASKNHHCRTWVASFEHFFFWRKMAMIFEDSGDVNKVHSVLEFLLEPDKLDNHVRTLLLLITKSLNS